MRNLPEGLAARLTQGATTLCRCWLIERKDGVALGFTDHDRDLTVDGVVCMAASGLNAGAIEASTGLSIDTQSVSGALSSGAITEADIERGAYDGAMVTALLADWQAPADRIVLSRGRIGEIRRSGSAFEAEVVSLAEEMNRPFGRAYLRTCQLSLGQPACGIDLAATAWRAEGAVTAVAASARFAADGLGGHPAGQFDGGGIVWTSGANAGVEGRVRRHVVAGGTIELELWLATPFPIASGDGFAVTAGCDKTFDTCRRKFANGLNFRGFPHMPGDDWATGYAREGGSHDGGSLNRS